MKDRIPTYPGRVKLIPVEGQENTYTLTMADEPTQEGMALTKANLIHDETIKELYFPNDMTDEEAANKTIADAFSMISTRLSIQLILINDLTAKINGDSIAENTDIHTVTSNGLHTVDSNAIALTCSHLPIVANNKPTAGYLEVFELGTTGYIFQRFTPYNNAGMFTRTYYPGNTSWGSWLKYSSAAVDTYTPSNTTS